LLFGLCDDILSHYYGFFKCMKHYLSRFPSDFSSFFVNISLVLYPVSVLLVPKVNGLIFVLFFIAGLVFIIRQREIAFKVSADEKRLFLAISIFFFAVLLITVMSGFTYKAIGKYLHLLFAIPVYLYLRHAGIKLGYVWYGLVTGSIVAALVAFYEVGVLGIPRARSLTHPIVFGDLSLIMGCMSLAGYGWFKQQSSKFVMLPVLALLCGIFASILSQSRGGWLAIPLLLMAFFWYMHPRFSFRLKAAIAVGVLVFFTVVYAIPQTGVSYQVDRTLESLEQYSDSEITSGKRATSVGTRLEMWQASWKMFTDNPVLGVGWGHYLEEAKKQVEQGTRNRSAASFDHPHSQYFTALASGGLVGFIVTMALFLVPAWLFIKYIKQHESDDISRLSLAGLLLIVGYMAFGISEPLLDRSRSVNFFALYLVVFMAAIYGQKEVISHKS